jgi:hypothetical protein
MKLCRQHPFRLALFCCLLLVTSCNNDSFRIKGSYKAPLSGFTLEVLAWGDLSEASALSGFGEYNAYFVPLPGGKTRGEPFHFEWRYPDKTDPAVYTFTLITKSGEQRYDDAVLEDILEDTLYALGYDSYDIYEVQEAIFAIYGAASGPDAAMQAGAAKYLEVLEVDLAYRGE